MKEEQTAPDRDKLLKMMPVGDRESTYRYALRRSAEIGQGIRKKLDTEKDREFWRLAEETAAEVKSWPPWKKG